MKNDQFISQHDIYDIINANLPRDDKVKFGISGWNFESNENGFFWVDDSLNNVRIGMSITPEGTWEIYTGINTNIHIVINPKDHTIEWRRDTDSLVKKVPRFIMYDIYVELCTLIHSKTNDGEESKITEGETKMSKKKSKPCITKDEIRKVLEETMKDCYSHPEWWHFCEQEHGLFYWEHEHNKAKIGVRLKSDSDVWEIYHSINDIGAVYILIHPNTGDISWEGDDIKSTLQPYMRKAFENLSELIKDKSTESKVVDTSQINTKEEKEMENENNYIKMDGEKDSFEGGAIRYTKKGKGRYDLIPSQQIHDILDYAKLNWGSIIGKDDEFCSVHNVLMSAYPDADDLTYDNYIEIIINIVRYDYVAIKGNKIFDAFMTGFVKMLKDLAIHYEMGAEKYGVDNWKNGIPETKGERGGSFRDSGLRHLQQLLDGKTDEPHQIAAIWNFIGAMYVKKHHNDNAEEHTDNEE